MILIIAKALVKDDSLELFKKEALELVENSRTEEGCIEYSLYEDKEKTSVLTFVEKWKNKASIEKHESTEFFKRRINKLMEYSNQIEISLNSEIL